MTENVRLKELQIKKQRRENYEQQKAALEDARAEAERLMYDCKDAMEAEQADVDKLEEKTFKNAILSWSGKLDAKKEKEMSEAKSAKDAYEIAKQNLEEAEERVRQLFAEENERRRAEQEFEKLFKERIAFLKESDSPEYKNVLHYQAILEASEERLKNLENAIAIGHRVQAKANGILALLKNAEDYAIVDVALDHSMAKIAEYDIMNKVQTRVKELAELVREFNNASSSTERIGVYGSVSYDESLMAANLVFDSIFIDVMILDSIEQTDSEVSSVLTKVEDAIHVIKKSKEREKEFYVQAFTDYEDAVIAI